MLNIARLSTADTDFDARLDHLLAWDNVSNPEVVARVQEIINQVRQRGDQALVDYTNQFDRRSVASLDDLRLSHEALKAAYEALPDGDREALEIAAARIRDYHQRQRQESWQYRDADGTLLGQQITPLDAAGLYVPGGKASYPSSVLMNALPAKVAGVGRLVMVVPAPGGELNPLVLAAAHVAQVDEVYTVGGAQAVAALAYGTPSIKRVDKIVGPGNVYVATAKRLVFGQVGLDMIAGPSEILVVGDGSVSPEWLAMDLLSQAEHDEDAQSILLSPDAAYLDAVQAELDRLLATLPREPIARVALEQRGALVKVRDMEEAIAITNRIAPEHLELAVADAEALVPRIRHAGAIFIGAHTPEAFGDYCAGPNHVLPTAGTARFSSPLGVYDFQKRSSLIGCSPAGAAKLAPVASTLAYREGLAAHARSAEYRKS